jgi:hypothetical protein
MIKLFTNNLTTKVLIVSLQRRYTLCKLVCSLSVQHPHKGRKHKVRISVADLLELEFGMLLDFILAKRP